MQPVLVFDLSSILTDMNRIFRKLLFCYLASLVTTVEDQAGPEEQETTCQLSSRHWPLGTAATCLNRHSFVAQPVCTHGLRLIQPLASGPGALSEQVSISVQVAQMAFLSPFLYALERSFTFLPRRSHNQTGDWLWGPFENVVFATSNSQLYKIQKIFLFLFIAASPENNHASGQNWD